MSLLCLQGVVECQHLDQLDMDNQFSVLSFRMECSVATSPDDSKSVCSLGEPVLPFSDMHWQKHVVRWSTLDIACLT